jgi:chloramphenicol 3-O-phosphotransferase
VHWLSCGSKEEQYEPGKDHPFERHLQFRLRHCILHALQDAMSESYLDAGIDKFIWMLPERYLERRLWDDVLGLATTAGETGHRLMHGMHETIATLSKAGLNVVADHVLVEETWLAE